MLDFWPVVCFPLQMSGHVKRTVDFDKDPVKAAEAAVLVVWAQDSAAGASSGGDDAVGAASAGDGGSSGAAAASASLPEQQAYPGL